MAKCTYNYVVKGNVRGEISWHRKIERALKSRSDDQRYCQAQGGYSDCEVYEVLHDESRASGRLRLRRLDSSLSRYLSQLHSLICDYEGL